MPISKKKIVAIEQTCVLFDILRKRDGKESGEEHWTDLPPEMWDRDDARDFDLLHDHEVKLKEEILKILNP